MITFSNLGKMGDLGNQLFQIAAVIGLANKNNDKYIFPEWKYKNYFNLYDCWGDVKPNNIYKEKEYTYNTINVNSKSNIIDLYGYFQSYKYFENVDLFIKNSFTPKISYGIQNITSIHVRRGDYLKLKTKYNQLNFDNYYSKAMSIINDDKYIVVSNDIDWCKYNFKGPKFTFSECKNEIDDFAIMISCKNNIIANSTFSYWAAYLNANPNKKVVSPIIWGGPDLKLDTKDLLPKEWIKI